MSVNRSVFSAVSWLSFGGFAARLLSVITMPVLTRCLSPQAYGEAALVSTIVSLASVVALAGIDMSYSRHAFSNKFGSGEGVEIFCWRWALGASCVVAIIIQLLWPVIANSISVPMSLSVFATIGVIFSALATLAQTRARLAGQYAKITWVQLASGVCAASTSLAIAMLWRQDASALLFSMIIGYSLPVIILGVPKWHYLLGESGLTYAQSKSILMTGVAGVVTAPAYWVLSSSDRWFLAAFHSSSEVGIYSTGYTIGTLGAVVSTAITSAWLPELSRAENAASLGGGFGDRKNRVILLLVVILMIVAVAVASSGGDIIRILADSRFHSATTVVPWLSAAVFFYGCLHVGNALLVMHGKLHWAGWAWFIALLVSLKLNLWLVPSYGALGAAFVQFVSFLVVSVLVWIAVLRFDQIQLPWARLMGGMGLSVVSVILMQFEWYQMPWVSLFLKLPVGMVYAIFCFWLVCPVEAENGIQKVLRNYNVWIGR